MLLTPSPHDPKKSLLSILMTAFYESSPQARDLYGQLDAYLANSPDRKDFHLNQVWNQVSRAGPPRPQDAATVPLKADQAYARLTKDLQQRFFGQVIEFVRHLNYGCATAGFSKIFRAANLPDNDDMAFLKAKARKSLPAMVQELRHESMQDWVIRDYSPAAMLSNVVAIRPDLAIVPSADSASEEIIHIVSEQPDLQLLSAKIS